MSDKHLVANSRFVDSESNNGHKRKNGHVRLFKNGVVFQ